MLVMLLMAASPAGAAPRESPPFDECPSIGADTSCGVLIVVNPDGTTTTKADLSQDAYDGTDDTLVGVYNKSASPLPSLPLSGPDIFGFDDDGLCTDDAAPAGCPFGDTGYEGPGTTFAPDSNDSGRVQFSGGLAPGATAYFSLEGPTSSLVPMAPGASTDPATAVGATAATLNATIDPHNESTDYYFEYGTDDGYGSETSSRSLDATAPESGATAQAVSAGADGLSPGTTYHYRVVASNAEGTSRGQDVTFTTDAGPPPLSGAPYVALGDSYSAGEGLPPYLEPSPSCHRSNLGYPILLAVHWAVWDAVDVACTGAVTDDLYHPQPGDYNEPMQDGQLDLLTQRGGGATGVVTLTLGGDDVGFAPVLTHCIAVGCSSHDRSDAARRIKALRGLAPASNVRTPKGRPIHPLRAVLEDIARAVPNATIALGNYPHLFPKLGRFAPGCIVGILPKVPNLPTLPNVPLVLSRGDVAWLNSAADDLNKAISAAVDGAHHDGVPNVRLADASGVFRGHEVACGITGGGKKNWIKNVTVSPGVKFTVHKKHIKFQGPLLLDSGSMHPTKAGQAGYASAFGAVLKGG
jgi:hypothetical protein